MTSCTKLVRLREWVEIALATAKERARWGWRDRFVTCGRPAIGHREATAWCELHVANGGGPKG